MGEFETINCIRELAEKAMQKRKDIRVGIGDDACVLAAEEGYEQVVSTDTLVENVHFRLDYFSYYQVGARAMAAALSDLAAMAAEPVGALAAVSIQAETDEEKLENLTRGLIDTGVSFGCPLIGGDLTRNPGPLVITVTVIGRVKKGAAILRSTARPGDQLWVTGTPGDAGAVIACCEETLKGGITTLPGLYEEIKERILVPMPRLAVARRLSKLESRPTAMVDISDGLAADLGHILDSSGVGARLFSDRLPVSDFSSSVARKFFFSPEHFLLYGGEDYDLLFTAPATGDLEEKAASIIKETGTHLSHIGELTTGPGRLEILYPDGKVKQIPKTGYDHFNNQSSL